MNSEIKDPYESVLADLRAKREQIDQTIKAIEAFRGSAPFASDASSQQHAPARNDTEVGAGEFLGMSIADAAKKLLSKRKESMGNSEIAKALTKGGLVMSANTEHQNIVGSVLTRRFQQSGDIVRVGRGIWGLREWYPNKTFKAHVKGNGDTAKAESTETGQPSEPAAADPLA